MKLAKLLHSDEEIVLSKRRHWVLVVPIVLVLPIFLLMEVAGFILYLVVFLVFWADFNKVLILTNQRLILKQGLLGTSLSDINFYEISRIRLTNSLFGRLVGFGELTIYYRKETKKITLKYLPNPKQLKILIEDRHQINTENIKQI